MSFYSMGKYSDFWLIFTEIELGGATIPLYLAPGSGWNWTTDVESARRFQYSYEALAHAYDHCPFKVYRSDLADGHIELNFLLELCTITRNKKSTSLTFDSMNAVRAINIPAPKRALALPKALPAPKEEEPTHAHIDN